MAVQENVAVDLVYKAESTFGTPNGTTGGQILRRVSSSLSPNRDSFASQERRQDMQVQDARLGTHRISGAIETELSLTTYNDIFEAVLRGTWTAGVSKTNTDFTSMAADAGTSKFTAGASTWVAQGFKVGDIIVFTGMSNAANNDVLFRITALSGVDATVDPAPTTQTADTAFTVAVRGSKLTTGTQKRSFTIEQSMPDIDISERFDGCRFGGLRLGLQPNGMASLGIDVMGQKATILTAGSAPYFTAPTAETTTGIFSPVVGQVSIGTSIVAVMTGLNFSVSNNLTSTPVLGSNFVPQIFYGRTIVQGSFTAYLENETFINALLNETELELVAYMTIVNAVAPNDAICFRFHRIKITGMQQQIVTENGLVATFNFQALLKSGGAGTAYDQSSMVIQRTT